MRTQLTKIVALGMLLILMGCERDPCKSGAGCDPPDPPLRPPSPVQKFQDDWSALYDSNLSPRQHAYCLSNSNKKSFTEVKDWIFLVNEAPRLIDGTMYGVLETKCSAILTIFSTDLKLGILKIGTPIIATGEFRGNRLDISEYVKLD